MQSYCGIDFGTSNSTIGKMDGASAALIAVEGQAATIPSSIFYDSDSYEISYGRAAINAYVEGEEGRLMRALKSTLGSGLIYEKTVIGRKVVDFRDVLGQYFGHLRQQAVKEIGNGLESAVIGRPVRFVDDDDAADAQAQETLADIAHASGFRHVEFQYEPIAAALDFESRCEKEQLVLIVDIGGGTSDFSIVRVGPALAQKADRADDILATAGVHIGGTDFDRLLSMAELMPQLGLGTMTKDGRLPLPATHYRHLATWHRINLLYTRDVMNELVALRQDAAEPEKVNRLIKLIEDHQGHALALAVEKAKTDLTDASLTHIELAGFAMQGALEVTRDAFDHAITASLGEMAGAVENALINAGLHASDIDAVFLTGGSSAVPAVRAALTAPFDPAKIMKGDLLGSVGVGLALDAHRRFG